MKEKSKLNIRQQSFVRWIIMGILWLGIAVSYLFARTTADVLYIIMLICLFANFLFYILTKRESPDEMSEYNEMKAKAKTRELMHYVLCIAAPTLALVFGLLKDAFNPGLRIIPCLCFLFMGIQDILTGILFCHLEAQ